MTDKKNTKKAVKKAVKKAPPPPPKDESIIDTEVTVGVRGAEYKGLCVSEKKIGDTDLIYLKLNGCVSRWFNKEDIVDK